MAKTKISVEIDNESGLYNRLLYVSNLSGNNNCRLRFSMLPEMELEESVEFFNKALRTYLNDMFFCHKEMDFFRSKLKFAELIESLDRNTPSVPISYYIVQEDTNK